MEPNTKAFGDYWKLLLSWGGGLHFEEEEEEDPHTHTTNRKGLFIIHSFNTSTRYNFGDSLQKGGGGKIENGLKRIQIKREREGDRRRRRRRGSELGELPRHDLLLHPVDGSQRLLGEGKGKAATNGFDNCITAHTTRQKEKEQE